MVVFFKSTCVLRSHLIPPHTPFYGKERLVDKPGLFRLGCLGNIFLEMNEMSLSLYGGQLTVFVSNDKNTHFQPKIWILENLFLATVSLTASQSFKNFPMRFVVIFNKWDFLILYNEKSQHLENLHKLVNQYFPKDCCVSLPNHFILCFSASSTWKKYLFAARRLSCKKARSLEIKLFRVRATIPSMCSSIELLLAFFSQIL